MGVSVVGMSGERAALVGVSAAPVGCTGETLSEPVLLLISADVEVAASSGTVLVGTGVSLISLLPDIIGDGISLIALLSDCIADGVSCDTAVGSGSTVPSGVR